MIYLECVSHKHTATAARSKARAHKSRCHLDNCLLSFRSWIMLPDKFHAKQESRRSNLFLSHTHTLVENNFHCLLDQHSMVANTENIRRLNSYLNFKSRIKITDGRTFIGTFVCIDKEKNIILAHTEEFRGGRLDRVCTAISF